MKLMDKLDSSSVKNLFVTRPEPEPLQKDEVALQQNVLRVGDHARKVGETYNQYGFRVAGLSEGNPHTLDPCLLAVCWGIKKEQEADESLQQELQKKLSAKKVELETDRKNKEEELEVCKNKQKSIAAEIQDQKNKLADLEDSRYKRNRDAWITLIITTVLLVPFTVYFFVFYSSVAYSAFFKEFDISLLDSGGDFKLSQAIFDAAAISNAWNDGWKVYFNGTKASHFLIAYVNKEKQYGTVSCDVPLYFYTTTTIANLYKVIASSDNYAYMEAVSSKKLPANTGAVIDVEVSGTVKTSTAAQVLFSNVSAADWSGNLLVANVEENPSFVGQETDGTYNLLLSDGKFVKANNGTLAAGLAYLPMNFGGGEAKELSLTTDEPTGIRTIDNGEPTVDNGAWYTIDGTRLQGEPTMKGIYVRGGKKVVVK